MISGPPGGGDTVAVRLSAPQPAAVAVIQVSGREASASILRFWKPAAAAAGLQLDRIRFGQWVSTAAPDAEGEDVVVCRVADDRYELHCHGGRAAQERIIRDLSSTGIAAAMWRPDADDSLAAAAGIDLLKAKTAKAAAVLHNQYAGRLSAKIGELIEASNSLTPDGRRAAVAELIEAGRVGVRLIDPFRVLLAGPPNVGKSTLLNRLLGWERAIVDAAPGTTRDALHEEMSLEGWPVVVIDSAGLRTTSDAVETAGVSHALELAVQCDCLCLLVDPAVGWTEWHDTLTGVGRPLLVIATKSDLFAPDAPTAGSMSVSAATGDGVALLIERLLEMLGFDNRLLDAPVPFRVGHLDALSGALESAESPAEFSDCLSRLFSADLAGTSSS